MRLLLTWVVVGEFSPREREREVFSFSRERALAPSEREFAISMLVRSFIISFSPVICRFVLVSRVLSFFSLRVLILSFSSLSLSRSRAQRRRLLQQRSRPGLGAAPDGNARAT